MKKLLFLASLFYLLLSCDGSNPNQKADFKSSEIKENPFKKEEVQSPKKECEERGGEYQIRKSGWFCNEISSDFGKSCFDSENCEGECLFEEKENKAICSKFKSVYGCFNFLRKGKPQHICID